MPIFKFECNKCNNIFEKICQDREVIETNSPCCNFLSKKIISVVNFKIGKYNYKPLKKSNPKSYVPTLRDLGLDSESKKKRIKKGY